jgi:hypothetical protein
MKGDDMTVAHHPHPVAPSRALFVALFVAIVAASLLVLDWVVVIPGGVANAAPAGGTNDSTTAPMEIGQQFYREKMMAPAQELPAQF